MDFDDTDQDKEKTTSQNGEFTPSLEEKLRILGNREWAQGLFDDVDGDADGKDETDLSGSVDHFKTGLVANGAISSGMYSALEARIDRAWQRNEREDKQQIQISIIEDREEKKRKQEEAAEEEFEGSIDRVKAEEKREREREEWSKSSHRFGNVEMTGEEWGEMATLLGKDSPLRRQMIERLMKKGKSKEEAEDLVDQAKRASYLMNIPENQRTEEQKAELRKLEQNEDVQDVVAAAKAFRPAEAGVKADRLAGQESQVVSVDAVTEKLEGVSGQVHTVNLEGLNRALEKQLPAHKGASTTAAVDEEKPFSSAPDLGEHYQKAVQATDPLDAEKAKPQQIAANDLKTAPPATAPGSGFEV